MQHARLSDDWSPPPTANSVTPLFRDHPLPLTPIGGDIDEETSLNLQYTNSRSKSSTRHLKSDSLRFQPIFRGYETPNFGRIAIHIVLCFVAYPAFYALTFVAKDKSLFTVRVLVATWCAAVGFALRYTLIEIGVQHIEAATWATLIHTSYKESGMKLDDLARTSRNPTSILSALRIVLCRFRSRGANRSSRKSYDKRPWTIFIVFFVIVAILGPLLAFLFGRVLDIKTFVHNQRMEYQEVLIAGDLSQEDVVRANNQLGAFESFAQTWTLLPYGSSSPDYVEYAYGNETIYFPQPSLSQFMPGGSGLGTFDANRTALLKDRSNNTKLGFLTNGNDPDKMGAVVRYPQWGISIHCKRLPAVNLVPLSDQSFTYAFLPQDLLRDLFAGYGMDLPASLTKPDLALLAPNDAIPSNIDPSKISYLVRWLQNGVAHSFHTRTVLDTTIKDHVWTTVETVLIRLQTEYTPSGRFPIYSNVTVNGVTSRIGYDAAVCVEKYEPWIVEAYNSSVGFPAILRIVERGYNKTLLPSGKIQGDAISKTRYLNTTGKNPAFYVAHDNSINQMVKDNGRDISYVPSPTAVSFTDGAGPEGYTELSADRFAVIRARVDACNVLPYLAGSGLIVAQSYPDQTLAFVTYVQWQLIGLLMLVIVLGTIGELFVPKLPLGVPQRGFGVYSLLALFQELQLELAHDLNKMSVRDLEEWLHDVDVKFVV